jgi:hypothetical protein
VRGAAVRTWTDVNGITHTFRRVAVQLTACMREYDLNYPGDRMYKEFDNPPRTVTCMRCLVFVPGMLPT